MTKIRLKLNAVFFRRLRLNQNLQRLLSLCLNKLVRTDQVFLTHPSDKAFDQSSVLLLFVVADASNSERVVRELLQVA